MKTERGHVAFKFVEIFTSKYHDIELFVYKNHFEAPDRIFSKPLQKQYLRPLQQLIG